MALPLPRQIPNLDGLKLPYPAIEAFHQLFQRLYDLRDSIGTSSSGIQIIQDTHANRSLHSPLNLAEGSLYCETDRLVIYIVAIVGGTKVWQWLVGTMEDVIASQPTDLGTNDVGFQFQSTDTYQEFRWSGSAWVEITQGNLAQIAYATAALALTGAFQDVVGATITLTRAGRHLITCCFDFSFTAGDNGFSLVGQLLADGAAQAQQVTIQSTGNANFMAPQQWLYTPTATGKIVKLQAKKLGGGGTSSANNPGTSISAVWIGP